ncbi:MAG: PUR family DNA/RNA-binding protein [Candidatus Daviesbacteria bacterium]|nr:PUR family DNA/RNA-binding protein [Candidatus Daviesbacteria bacterium]
MGNSFKKPVESSILKCGKRTFFFDINLASNNKKYLKITESAFVGENGERKRNTFLLFAEDVLNFKERLNEIAGHLS